MGYLSNPGKIQENGDELVVPIYGDNLAQGMRLKFTDSKRQATFVRELEMFQSTANEAAEVRIKHWADDAEELGRHGWDSGRIYTGESDWLEDNIYELKWASEMIKDRR